MREDDIATLHIGVSQSLGMRLTDEVEPNLVIDLCSTKVLAADHWHTGRNKCLDFYR